MIDTIILTIPDGNYSVFDHSRFTPSTIRMRENNEGYAKYTNNPTAEEKKKGLYLPRLTIYKRGRSFDLKVEFSAPKMIYGNNLDEVGEQDFEQIADTLHKKIMTMGISISKEAIKKARVMSFHPSKNIPLSNGYTASFVIRELYKTDLSLKFDIDEKTFRNNGKAIQFYTNSHSVVFYDKINDLSKPSKRAIDKDQTCKQSTIFDYLKSQTKLPEILRYEVRLSKKKKMTEVLKNVQFRKENPSFEEIFKEKLCQKILLLYWNKFFDNNQFLFDVCNTPQNTLNLILKKFPKKKPKQIIYLTGLYLLCKDNEGIRGLREAFRAYRPKAGWTATKRVLEGFRGVISREESHGFVRDIEKTLNDFKPYRVQVDKNRLLSM